MPTYYNTNGASVPTPGDVAATVTNETAQRVAADDILESALSTESAAREAADLAIIAAGVPVATAGSSFVTASGAGATRTLSDWTAFITARTPSTTVNTPEVLLNVASSTPGAEGYQLIFQSFTNPAPQSATQNRGVWTGFNAGRHTGGTAVVANKPALIMGFEDNYYDSAGDLEFGMEWYIEYWSPNGTSVQMRRPFYTRILSNDNTRDGCVTVMNIGTDGLGQWTVQAGLDQLLYIDGDQTLFYKPTTFQSTLEATSSSSAGTVFKGGVWIDKKLFVVGDVGVGRINATGDVTYNTSTDRMTAGILTALPSNSIGSYIGWANGIAGTLTGDLVLIPRSDIGGAIRFFTGSGTPAKVLDLGPAAIGFFGTAAAAKPTVTGSKGGNAALTSLLTALSGLGLITDSST